jgi:hypothetical protein
MAYLILGVDFGLWPLQLLFLQNQYNVIVTKKRGAKQQSDPFDRAHINRIRTCVHLTILQHDSSTDLSPGSLFSNSTIPKRETIQQQHTIRIPTNSASTHEIRLIRLSVIKTPLAHPLQSFSNSTSFLILFVQQIKQSYLA